MKTGEIGTGVAQFEARNATFLRLTIEKDATVMAEKIFEPGEFDRLRGIREDKTKILPHEGPAKSRKIPVHKP